MPRCRLALRRWLHRTFSGNRLFVQSNVLFCTGSPGPILAHTRFDDLLPNLRLLLHHVDRGRQGVIKGWGREGPETESAGGSVVDGFVGGVDDGIGQTARFSNNRYGS